VGRSGVGVGDLERAQRAPVAGPAGGWQVPLAPGAVVEPVQAVVADLGQEPLGEPAGVPQGNHEPQARPVGRAQVLDVAQRRVGAHQQAGWQQLRQPFQRRPDAGQLGGIAGVGRTYNGSPAGLVACSTRTWRATRRSGPQPLRTRVESS
jgi:hypothetical protein